MANINWSELFPGRWSAFIFVFYMALFINQGILVTWSQRNGGYQYNIVIVVLMSEVIKLITSLLLYCRENNIYNLIRDSIKYKRVLLLYMVPSSLYCLYNNLAFVNLAAFDPPTYFLLLQFRVVITGIIFQVVFKKSLSVKQWISLVILTLGCMIKHINLDSFSNSSKPDVLFNIKMFFILVQVICSCLAGVYNEYLLKGEGANVNIFLQNVFMYIDSIICNIAVLIVQGNIIQAFDNAGSSIFMDPKVLLIMFNNAAIGIITSFFLKNLNSILKTFASALELIFTAILCWIIFSIPIQLNTVLAIAVVSFAIILYSQNPVQNSQQKVHEDNDISRRDLIARKELMLV